MHRALTLLAAALVALTTTAAGCGGPRCLQYGQQYEPGHYEPGHYHAGSCSGSGKTRRCSAGYTTPGHYVSGHYVSVCVRYEEKHQ